MNTAVEDILKQSKASEKAKEAWTNLSESARRRLVEDAVSEWARTTSMHGISRLTKSDCDEKRHRLRRVVWAALLLVSFGVLLYQLTLLVLHYAASPVGSRTIEEDAKVANFPAVTLCPLNSLSRMTMASASPEVKAIARRVFGVTNAVNSTNSSSATPENSTCEEKWAKAMPNMPSKDNYVAGSILMACSMLNSETLLNLSVPLSRMLLDCEYYGRQCTPRDFVVFRNAVFGFCYTFNFDGSRQVTMAGAMNSLKLTLALNQSDYLDNGSGDAGFRVLVHQPGTYPFTESRGRHVGPGVSLQMGVKFKQSENLEPPYGTCRLYTEAENRRLNWYVGASVNNQTIGVNYSHQACSFTCQQRLYIAKCGCFSPCATVPDELRSRLPPCEMRKSMTGSRPCVTAAERTQIANACADECRFACNRRQYPATISFAQFPSESYMRRVAQLAAASGFGADMAKAKAAGDFVGFARSNFLRISVFAESLKIVRRQQFPNYLLKDLLSDCGGQAGFWLGLSVLTVCEILELLTRLFGGTLIGAKTPDD